MRFLKKSDKDTGLSSVDMAFGDDEHTESEAMDEEQPPELDLARNESIFMRRFDPDYMMQMDLSRSVSMKQNRDLNANMDQSAELDYGTFMKEQHEWEGKGELGKKAASGQTMMEEIQNPQAINFSDELLDYAIPLQSKFSFLGGEDKENVSFSSNPNYGKEYLNILGYPTANTQVPGMMNQAIDDIPQPKALNQIPLTRPRQAQDEIFSHNGESGGRLPPGIGENRPTCNCTKSQCLKLYCLCFKMGYPCHANCRCCNCKNTQKNHSQVIIRRDQKVLRQGVIEGEETFCNCRMSFCEKSYCVCARKGTGCSSMCKCFHCKNSHGVKVKNME
jgi:Tesmin/TSO1-like CXC domain, cysteine-rich domain